MNTMGTLLLTRQTVNLLLCLFNGSALVYMMVYLTYLLLLHHYAMQDFLRQMITI